LWDNNQKDSLLTDEVFYQKKNRIVVYYR